MINNAMLPVRVRNLEPDYRYGYCRCGCGEKTSVPKHSDVSKGWVAGVPLLWINGHACMKGRRYAVNPETGCWEWLLHKTPNGYARLDSRGQSYPVHRLIYELLNGPVPKTLDLDHVCRNRGCVNPEHLRVVTRAENTQYGKAAKLDPDKVRKIRLLAANGRTQRSLAAQFGVTKNAITSVVNRWTWRNVE